jgi:hypothetical protein
MCLIAQLTRPEDLAALSADQHARLSELVECMVYSSPDVQKLVSERLKVVLPHFVHASKAERK